MKTLPKFIYKTRLVIKLWSTYQKMRLIEAILDSIDKDISSARAVKKLIEDFVPNPAISKKIAQLETDREVNAETLTVHQRQLDKLRKELAA